MGLTKREYIERAYSEIGMADYVFDLQPEQMQTALRTFDAMMMGWDGGGIRIGWVGGQGMGEIDVETATPLWADDAIITNLAVRLSPSVGKTPSQITLSLALQGLNLLRSRTAQPTVRALRGYAGAGSGYNRPGLGWGGRLPEPPTPIELGNDDTLTFRSAT